MFSRFWKSLQSLWVQESDDIAESNEEVAQEKHEGEKEAEQNLPEEEAEPAESVLTSAPAVSDPESARSESLSPSSLAISDPEYVETTPPEDDEAPASADARKSARKRQQTDYWKPEDDFQAKRPKPSSAAPQAVSAKLPATEPKTTQPIKSVQKRTVYGESTDSTDSKPAAICAYTGAVAVTGASFPQPNPSSAQVTQAIGAAYGVSTPILVKLPSGAVCVYIFRDSLWLFNGSCASPKEAVDTVNNLMRSTPLVRYAPTVWNDQFLWAGAEKMTIDASTGVVVAQWRIGENNLFTMGTYPNMLQASIALARLRNELVVSSFYGMYPSQPVCKFAIDKLRYLYRI